MESIEYTMIKLDQMVLKGVIWVQHAKSGHMVLKGVNWVHNGKLGQMVLKGVIWVHNTKSRSYALDRSQLGTE